MSYQEGALDAVSAVKFHLNTRGSDWSLPGDVTPLSVPVHSALEKPTWHTFALVTLPKLGTDCQKCSLPVPVRLGVLRSLAAFPLRL